MSIALNWVYGTLVGAGGGCGTGISIHRTMRSLVHANPMNESVSHSQSKMRSHMVTINYYYYLSCATVQIGGHAIHLSIHPAPVWFQSNDPRDVRNLNSPLRGWTTRHIHLRNSNWLWCHQNRIPGHMSSTSAVVMVLIGGNDDGDDDDSGIKRGALHIIPLRNDHLWASPPD